MTWFLTDVARLKSEREAIERFGIEHDWFTPLDWRLDDRFRLVLDADIVAGERTWPVYLQYPQLFPHTPPSVYPRGDNTRWASHQYGPGGELCLEFGPDNWTPDLSGVQQIESTRRLLLGENPAPGLRGTVASRHFETLGQELRSATTRFVQTRASAELLNSVPVGELRSGSVVSSIHKEGVIHVLHTLKQNDGTVWRNADVPKQLAEECVEREIAVIRLESNATLPPTSGLKEFKANCATLGLITEHSYAIILRGNETNFYFCWDQSNSVIKFPVIPAQREERRLGDAHQELHAKKVGLVGCGSLGSKLATMLSRTGVSKWVLADDDLLLPDNLVRNELDWRDVGAHKVQALARRLEFVNPGVEVSSWKARIGGQTSSASADAILDVLGSCDLIIDATANPDILNVLAAVAAAKRKPVVWAEVFGGGLGGIIGRCRPRLEPELQYMRRAIESWFADQNARPASTQRSYEAGDEAVPLIADDADVSVIASHAARLAIDLLSRQASAFPHSVYAIGLAAGSVFSEPFDTKPIDVGLPTEVSKPILTKEETTAELARLLALIRPPKDEATTS